MNSIYQNKLRVRALGLLIEDGKLLLIELDSPVSKQKIWTAPGGGVEFGESIKQALVREFREETGLLIKVKELVHINELIASPFQAIEFYFKVERIAGELILGIDPERVNTPQILRDIKFIAEDEISKTNIHPEFLVEVFNNSLGNIPKFSFKDEAM